MKLLKIKNIEKDFVHIAGKIYNIEIENLNFYHQLIFSILYNEKNLFSYSENYVENDLEKNILTILNPLDIDANNKKMLNNLYKKIQANFISINEIDDIENINAKILSLLTKLSLNMNLPMNFETELDILKILNLYKFSFQEDIENYLQKLVIFIKANLEIFSYNFIISFNLLSLLSNLEIENLKKELELLELTLVNINLSNKIKSENIDFITIDKDLCEF